MISEKYSWEMISSIHESVAIKSAVIWFVAIPIFAKIFQTAEEQSLLPFSIELPFTWGIFYIASVAFFITAIVYAVVCPTIVKKYRGFDDFLQLDGSRESVVAMLAENIRKKSADEQVATVEALLKTKYVKLRRYVDGEQLLTDDKAPIDKLELAEMTLKEINENPTKFVINRIYIAPRTNQEEISNNEALSNTFFIVRNYANFNDKKARIAILLLHAIGFSALGYVILQNIWSVMDYYFHRL